MFLYRLKMNNYMVIILIRNHFGPLLLIISLVTVVVLSGCLESTPRNPVILNVKNMEIVQGETKTSTIELNITTYIEYKESTVPKTSKNLTLQLKATDTSKDFLANQTSTFLGKMNSGQTINTTQVLVLPKKGGYNLVATLFEDGKEVDWGRRTIYNLENLPADTMITGLRIDGIDFIVRKVSDEKVVIQSDIYVTNSGAKTSKDYQLMIKATDMDSRLVADKQWSSTGNIIPDGTAIRSVNLTVPDKYNYFVDVLIWSDSVVVGGGQDSVLLNATTMMTEKERIATRGTRTGGFVVAEPVEEPKEMEVSEFEGAVEEATQVTPGFGALLALAMVCLGVQGARRKRKS